MSLINKEVSNLTVQAYQTGQFKDLTGQPS